MNIAEALKGLKAVVEARFPGEPVYTGQVPSKFQRPALLVQCGPVRPSPVAGGIDGIALDVTVTAFTPVDDYHNSKPEDLAARLSELLGLFTCYWSLPIGERWVEVTDPVGDYGLDYAEVKATLRWTEPRGEPAVGETLMMMTDFHFTLNDRKD